MPRPLDLSLLIVLGLWLGQAAAIRGAEPQVEQPLAPLEAARTMQVPDGFQVTLFAGEPDVQQPIGFCIDDRGRLWVAEAYNYPTHGTRPGDRIIILEDTDGDGRFDKRTVFYDQLNYVTGVEVGFGGVWAMSPPSFYFIPDRDGDDRPDGPPVVLLDGFGNHANAHNLANGLAWGPDGWLYGTHGRTNWSLLGKPGTPDAQRVRFDGGVYRYHPQRHVWEPFADGSTNPWGIDWNDVGEAFVCNCVNPHLFHVIPGAHYEPWRNRASSQYAFERIPSIADHLHFIGTAANVRGGLGTAAEDEAGGGHAHCGTMVYLGDNWPERYRNSVFMHNIHGKRINNDLLQRKGSGYTASHGRDLLRARDPWYMGVTLAYGPDGAVYSSDWSDTGECHSVKNTQRQTGRIFKIAYGRPAPAVLDLARQTDLQLVEWQSHRNDWYVRHARRLLQERAAAGNDMTRVHEALRALFARQTDVPRQLRALWALYVTGGAPVEFLLQNLAHDSEYIRVWCARLLAEGAGVPDEVVSRFRELAATGKSPFERLYLASLLQRLPSDQRWGLAAALLARGEDAEDTNLPLMVWYGIEPLVEADLPRFLKLAAEGQIPLVRRHAARRGAGLAEPAGALALITGLAGAGPEPVQHDLLQGMLQGLEGRRRFPMPAGWREAYSKLQSSPRESVREQALQLALVFDDPDALRAVRATALDRTAPAGSREKAIHALVARKPDGLAALLLELLNDPDVRRGALRGLAEYDDSRIPPAILARYGTFDATLRQDAIQTLSSRSAWGLALLDAVESKKIPRTDLTAFTVRQLLNLKNKNLSARVGALWGDVRPTAADKARLIAGYKQSLTSDALAAGDRSSGRIVFEKTCAACHKLFGSGGEIGPDITGAQRQNLDYLLENLVDPSAAIVRDYQMQIIETTEGRVVTGLVVADSAAAVTIQTVNERVVIPVNEIESRTTSSVSMMPDGLLQQLSPEQVRNLVAYVMGAMQVPRPDAAPAGGGATTP
jgi:putative membrane-bound dehydrogenase-like protein